MPRPPSSGCGDPSRHSQRQGIVRILSLQGSALLLLISGRIAVYGGLSVYTGNAHPTFARDICRSLEIPLGAAEVFKFANDNIFVKVNENVREHDVFVVQS
ncbi:MAG: ribose-phosphate pyrophosphokinase-like domain-containing protein, partial [Chloroflexota bacterium]